MSFYETTNIPIVAFHNSLDDTNPTFTPGYPQNRLCHPLHPAASAHNKPGVTFAFVLLCQKKLIQPLTSDSEKLYLLKQTISAGGGSSRNRALSGSCR